MKQVIDRRKIKTITYYMIIIFLSINLIGCDILTSVNLWHSKKPISINAIAQKNKNRIIYITGKVIKLAPLLGKNAYQIQDDTGNIWVVTTEKLPYIEQNIYIKCKIKSQSLSLGNQELDDLYLVELERLDNY